MATGRRDKGVISREYTCHMFHKFPTRPTLFLMRDSLDPRHSQNITKNHPFIFMSTARGHVWQPRVDLIVLIHKRRKRLLHLHA